MGFRRFLYLVADDCVERSYSLRRIDMSRFFRPLWEGAPTPLDSSGGSGATVPLATEDAGSLPEPALSVRTPQLEQDSDLVNFMLFKRKGRDGENLHVVTIDHTGSTLLCDPSLEPVILPLPKITPKLAPFSLTVGSSLYVMDALPKPPNGSQWHSFEALSYGHRHRHLYEWYWHSLPPPPYLFGPRDPSHHIESYAVVAGAEILMSNKAKHTYCFDTVKRTWNKAGDWSMPFYRLAEYVPEHKLWFGLSSKADGCRFLAANLVAPSDAEETVCTPVVHGSWKECIHLPPEWSLVESYAVYLGSSKFCIIRLFEVGKLRICSKTQKTYMVGEELQAVLTGVEVQSCGQELCVFKHKSERYKLQIQNDYWVL